MFVDRMPKLTAFVTEIKRWLKETQRLLLVHLESRGIVLEAQLSSPFLSLFSNQIPNQEALKVLDRFVHFGQSSLLAIVKYVFITQKNKILQTWDQFTLQVYLSKQVYLDALVEGKFFPPVEPTNKQNVLTQTTVLGRRSQQLIGNLQGNASASVLINQEEHIETSVRTTIGTSLPNQNKLLN